MQIFCSPLFFQLPTSYYHIGADVTLQDFILRYGTHYVKSAKFGGKLNIFKKVAKDSRMTSAEFAKASESEFSAMMSTLRNSYQQTHAKVRIRYQFSVLAGTQAKGTTSFEFLRFSLDEAIFTRTDLEPIG